MDSSFSLTNIVAAAITFFTLFGSIFFLFFKKKITSHQENQTMDSSLSLLSPPSSLPLNGKHHLFVSFHGSDVRVTLLSHILEVFRSKGISPFIDNDMDRGVSIGPELIGAIRESRIALVLLSENYASSTWCLNELVEIIKCRDELKQKVMTLFYKVDPSDVKKQSGDFGKVFKETCKGKKKEDIQKWEHALKEVAQIAGYHSGNWNNEAEMIKTIATDVSNKLNISSPSSDFEGLVGMESHMTEMRPLLQLDSEEVRVIGIWGPPGIGKTTIARSLFDRHSGDFQHSLFMDNIKTNYGKAARSDDYSVKLYLQKQLMSQLVKEEALVISHLGTVQDRLKDKKVLVVLDDVNQLVQLEAMANETCWFGRGSRIIITTQDQKLLKASGVNDIYKVDLPSTDEALQMFCMYAFRQKEPEAGFMEIAREVTEAVGRLPLGLKIMGSYFRGLSKSKQEWEKALRRLSISLDGDIKSILMFSYEALHDEDKKLFLHIACFFKGESVEVVEGCLAYSFTDVTLGLRVLAEKSLIDIDSGEIEMHDLLIKLGREIMRKQSDREPGKRQFLNHHAKDFAEVLSDNKADTSSVIGISLWFRKYSNSEEDMICTSKRAFERFSNLRFLNFYDEEFKKAINSRSLNYISRNLRFLSWQYFRMPCLPSNFDPEFLVKLDMHHSKLEKLWDNVRPLGNLKEMDLSYSKSLKKLPDLSTATNLCKLNLCGCSSLVELPCSIGNAVNLETLFLSYCTSLVELPCSIGNAVNLKTLDLSGCSSLVELPCSIGNAVNLKRLDLSYCTSLVELPCSIGNAVNLKALFLSCCTSLVELPCSIGNAVNLKTLFLSYCTSLVELPCSIGNAVNLKTLNLRGCSSLVELPCSIGNAVNLKALFLNGCTSLVELPCSIGNAVNLETLDLSYCTSLVELPCSIGNAVNLKTLNLSGCSSLVELPCSMRNLCRLSKLGLPGCSNLVVNLANINLESLEELDISDCSVLKSYPEIFTSIEDYHKLSPRIGRRSRLRRLVLSGMQKLGRKSRLRLHNKSLAHGAAIKEAPSGMSNCEIRELGPWIGTISRLRRLTLSGMKKLVSLPQLPYSLVELHAEDCESLERLDCSFSNPDIRLLNFANCDKLNQEARDLIIQTPTTEYAVLPGGEVPECFPFRSSGSSVTVKLNQMPLGASTKFKVCIVYAFDKDENHLSRMMRGVRCSITSKQNAIGEFYKYIDIVWEKHLYIFEVEAVEVTSTELVFEFEYGPRNDRYSPDTSPGEIKECGVLQL